ncbi:copia protein [Lasius niger]|uniref:Copia protein n=1 Tax=Lasius niger TaxID=67767 RepID=A0A0J7NI47_LASNI|nr:copia protein [Lasius niger]
MWDKLHEIFENKSETAKHILQQQWYTLGRETADDIATHIAKIKDLAHQLNMFAFSHRMRIDESRPEDLVKPHGKAHDGRAPS